MTYPSRALLDKLAGLLGPKGYSEDEAALAPWLTDWRGRYSGRSSAMLSPGSTLEVSRILRWCASEGVPIVPQGGNSSMVGGATPSADGRALLLSLRRMNAIRSLDAEAGLAVCEAGVILSDLHDAALAEGHRFPLTLGAKGSATIGGLVSTNAGGTQVIRFGTMRGLVQGIEAVLPDGSIFDGLAPLKKDNRGYSLTQLLIGAEGTLGVVTAASLKLVPAAAGRITVWAGCDSPHMALHLLRHLEAATGEAIESFELVPAAALDLVLAHIPGTRPPLQARAPWNILIEAIIPKVGPNPQASLEDGLRAAFEKALITDATIAANEAQANALWRLRDSISEAEKKDGPATKHDISVPVAAMPGFALDASRDVEARFPGTRVIAFGHLGDGNLHFNVRAPEGADGSWLDREGEAVSSHVYDLVAAANGSISAEHGIGQMKVGELARLGEPARLMALRAIKQALDPKGIMNPGKLVPLAEPSPGT